MAAFATWRGISKEALAAALAEPEVQVIVECTKSSLTTIRQLAQREGYQEEYTVSLDGTYELIPERLAKVGNVLLPGNKAGTWMHRWDAEGLLSEQVEVVNGVEHVVRLWRTVRGREMVAVLGIFKTGGGKEEEVLRARRFYRHVPFRPTWTAASAQFFSGNDTTENLGITVGWMRKAKAAGAALLVTPENTNRDRTYFKDGKPSPEVAWECCEALDGPFVTGLCRAAREIGIWVCAGVDYRGAKAPDVHIGQVLIRPDGEIAAVHTKKVLWDYEYTIFVPGTGPYVAVDTELGRMGLLMCADGIVPECTRVLALKGVQVLLNSLNSRGPDELRTHIPCRALENGVWHIASNTIGNPHNQGLLWPWAGGSQVIDPAGRRLVEADEREQIEEMILAEIRPFEAEGKGTSWVDDLTAQRRPELYGAMTASIDELPCAPMYGPVGPGALPFPGPDSVKVAMMQFSRFHTRVFAEWAVKRQAAYAKRKGAQIGVLPELCFFKRGEVEEAPESAAAYGAEVLAMVIALAKETNMHLCFSNPEEDQGLLYHTAYLVGPTGLMIKYRKAHLNRRELQWATPGAKLAEVVQTELGRVALMVGDEVYVTEVGRCLALNGVEIVLHPADWCSDDEPNVVATERAGESRFHMVSVTRMDSVDAAPHVGSQTTLAGEFIDGEPIPLMRYSRGIWCRAGVEECTVVDLERREPHCKMMGWHLDVLKKRYPECYKVCTVPTKELYLWRNITQHRPGTFPDVLRAARGTRSAL